MGEHASHHLKRASSVPRTSYTCGAADKPSAWDMTPINPGHAFALIFVRLLLISLIALGGWEVALWVTNESRTWPRNTGGLISHTRSRAVMECLTV